MMNERELKIANRLLNEETEETEETVDNKKRYYIQNDIGKVKYVINFHDGVKKHKDGSDFYDIMTFKNKKDLENFEQSLLKKNYKRKPIGK